MATSVLGLKTFTASDPVDYNEVNDNYTKIDNGVKTALQGRAAHNLLDNSDFRIAQAGYGGMHGTQKYACDRWYDTYGFGSFSFNELQGLTVAYGTNHAYLVQKIKDASLYHGKTMTMAFGLSDGTIRTANGVWLDNTPSFAINFDNGTATLYTNSVDLVVTSGSLTVKWAALYEGSYTADTLPAYQPKGYAVELAECQMYLYDPIIGGSVNSTYIGTGFKINDTTIYFTVPIPTMRKTINTPTLTAKNISIFENSGNIIVPSELYVLGKITDGVATICARTNSALSAGKVYTLFAAADDSSLQFSNDL